jgi:gluconolactonase
VYRVSPDLQTITLVVDDFVGPNGLCFSPSERTLYINDSRVGLIKAFDVLDDGTIANGRLFCMLKDERPGVPDGMKVDLDGNLYCTGPGGVWIIDPSGKHLGTIALGDGRRATNVGWGGGDWKTLFITTFHELARVRMKIPGVPVPRRIY